MSRLVNTVLSLWPLALLVGCVTNDADGGIFVRGAVVPMPGCVVTATAGETGLSHGALSTVFPAPYRMTAQMESRITATVGHEIQRTVVLTGANVDLTFPDSTLFSAAEIADMQSKGVTHFKSLFSASLEPNNAITDATFDLTTLALTDAILAKAPEAKTPAGTPFELEVLATFTVLGTMSGAAVNSQPFQFPISIANDNNLIFDAGACPLPLGSIVALGNGCGLPQDAPTTCCETNGQLMCPASIATAVAP